MDGSVWSSHTYFGCGGGAWNLGIDMSLPLAFQTLPNRAGYRLCKRLAVDRNPHPGYEWVTGREIPPIEVSAEFDVAAE
jgi:hypothetical protein